MKKIIAATLLLAIAFTACKKNKDNITPTPIPTPTPTPQTVKDIYVGGYELTEWTPPSGIYFGYYSNIQARVWKNGVQMPITTTTVAGAVSVINDIAVLGNDVYAVGYMDTAVYSGFMQYVQKPVMWKNGVPTILTPPGVGGAGGAKCIEISGNDIYIAGQGGAIAGNSAFNGTCKIWKNGVPIYSADDTQIRGLKVVGNDVYAVLRIGVFPNTVGALWKNGVVSNLSTTPADDLPNGVNVIGTDVYVYGAKIIGSNPKATIWKNGVEDVLAPAGGVIVSPVTSSYVTDVAVEKGNVIVVGFAKNFVINGPSGLSINDFKGIEWKNGNYVGRLDYAPYGVGGVSFYKGIEYVNGAQYIVAAARTGSNATTGYYTATALTGVSGGISNLSFTVTPMAETAGNIYGAEATCMFITKQ